MEAELKPKFLRHLNRKKQNEGFTIIELLIVMIILSVISAFALPHFVSQAAKAKQSEAKTFVGAVNRAQQAYRLENTRFAPDPTTLKIDLPTETASYIYVITSDTATALVKAFSKDPETLKSYAGGVIVMNHALTLAVACQTTNPSDIPPRVDLSTTTGASCESTEHNMK